MNFNQIDDCTTATSFVPAGNYCGDRLPCGRCRLTMVYCPSNNTVTITTACAAETDLEGNKTGGVTSIQ